MREARDNIPGSQAHRQPPPTPTPPVPLVAFADLAFWIVILPLCTCGYFNGVAFGVQERAGHDGCKQLHYLLSRVSTRALLR